MSHNLAMFRPSSRYDKVGKRQETNQVEDTRTYQATTTTLSVSQPICTYSGLNKVYTVDHEVKVRHR